MFNRKISTELLESAKKYPVITVIGPRQSGKTTLVRNLFPYKPYVNLESPDIREIALADPKKFLDQYPDGVILDEIQRAPILISFIQSIVDERKTKGMYILTGSHQIELHQTITQSLAGRTSLLILLPMSLLELQDANIIQSIDESLLKGGYPAIYKDQLNPTKAYRNYFQTYIERDLRQLIHVKDLSQFQRFIKLCAGRIGQLLNLENLGNEVGVSSNTIKNWISILEASFILIRIQPYFENFGKRIIKSSKIYFTDVGIACYLLGIENTMQLERDPLRGNLIENLVVLELIKARLNQGLDPQLYYYRDSNGREIDLIFQEGHELVPIEIKSSQTFSKDFLKNLHFFKGIAKERFKKGFVIYGGSQEQEIGDYKVLNINHSANIVL